MMRSTPFRFSPFEISLAILAALALMLSPHVAFAQRAGGHAGGGGHFGSGGGHFGGGVRAGSAARPSGFGAAGHSSAGSHISSPIHVFSGPRSAPVAAAPARAAENSAALNERDRGAAVQLRSSSIFVSPAGDSRRGPAMFADPRGSSEALNPDARRTMPLHTTIGFPPSTDPRFTSIASAHRGAPLMFSGQGQQAWQSSQRAAANRDSVRITDARPPQRVFPKPPHIFRRPFLGGAPFLIGSPGFIFFGPGFGFFGSGFGPGFGCDPFFTPSFGCIGFSPLGFGGFSFLGFDGGFGSFGDSDYGYDSGGYYPVPQSNHDVTPDEGASQEPAPSEWQNPPADNSSPDNSAAENAAPDTVIYLKDGTSFAVKDYWVADGKLHYVASYGGENAVDLGDFDLQRTTDENAGHGISITLRPAPESQPPASQTAPPPVIRPR